MRVRSPAHVVTILNETCGEAASSVLVETFGRHRVQRVDILKGPPAA